MRFPARGSRRTMCRLAAGAPRAGAGAVVPTAQRGGTVRPIAIIIASLILGVIGCALDRPEPAPPPATIEPAHLMTGLVLLHHHSLLTALTEAPAAPEEWESAESHAALLAEAADILLRHASATDESWLAAAGLLKEGSVEAMEGLRARSLAEARVGFEHLNVACSTCHQECGAGDAPPWKAIR